ncbi:hypothetical protein CC80DRAFT_490825 [Byssothecium circinans]|uniref:Uncharacterized protein n=1 Tax=Byssothecium circinans TaxID=147558 RepID=A0A6A5UAR6_9PLEO|nr:hypothetical protein CC80DRAFT_490825 [Byssothecium circinans]
MESKITEDRKSNDASSPTKDATGSKPLQYADYIASLPPPHYAQKVPPSYTAKPGAATPSRSMQSSGETAARVNAVCAPITSGEDVGKRTWRERWKDWTTRSERKKDPDLRPMDHGSSARLNVWGVPVTGPERKRK